MNKIIVQPEQYLVGISCRTSNAKGEGEVAIPALWQEFFNLDDFPNKLSNDIIALYSDYETDHLSPYTLTIGYQVANFDEVPTELTKKVIPQSTFAVFPVHTPPPQGILETWQTIWNTDLPRTYAGDFERYHADQKTIEILIAVKE